MFDRYYLSFHTTTRGRFSIGLASGENESFMSRELELFQMYVQHVFRLNFVMRVSFKEEHEPSRGAWGDLSTPELDYLRQHKRLLAARTLTCSPLPFPYGTTGMGIKGPEANR